MMTWNEMLALANPLLGTGVNVVIMGLIPRLVPGMNYFRSVFVGFGAGFAAMLMLEGVRYSMETGDSGEFFLLLASNIAIYAFLGFLFFTAVNVGESSIRVRILRELMRCAAPISEAELLSRYNDRSILTSRLDRLVETGQINIRGGRYFVRPGNLLRIAKLMRLIKVLLLRRTSEFD